jgi:LysM repeat protein
MQKDLKIGMIVGLAVVSVAVLWLATRPGLSPEALMLDTHGVDVGSGSVNRSGVAGGRQEDADTRERDNVNTSTARVPIRHTRTNETIGRSSLSKPATYEQPERFHVVRDGETLSQISYDYYGSAGKWQKIFDANRKAIKDANVVKSGTKLIIPN